MAGRRTAESRHALREMRADLRDPAPVMEAAAAFLAVRSRSVAETTQRLLHLGYPRELVDEVVTRLIELNYLDDAAFAREWLESRDRARPRGTTVLRRELALKGIERDTITEALAGRAESAADPDRTAARALLDRRRSALEREPDPVKRRQRAYALLARNGFDPETCREVSASLVASP